MWHIPHVGGLQLMGPVAFLFGPIVLVFLLIILILFIIRSLLRYRLESKRIEAGYYQQAPQQPPQVRADLAVKRAYRNAWFLIIAGIVLHLLGMRFLATVGSILVILGVIWLIDILLLRNGNSAARLGTMIDRMAPQVCYKNEKLGHFHRLIFRALILLGLGIGFLISAFFWRPLEFLVPAFAILFGLGLALTIYYIIVRRDFDSLEFKEKKEAGLDRKAGSTDNSKQEEPEDNAKSQV